MQLKLKLKGNIYATVLPMFVIIGVALTVSFMLIFSNYINDSIRSSLQTGGRYYSHTMDSVHNGEYNIQNDELYKGDTPLKDITTLDSLKENTGYEYTIFKGDVRINTTLANEDRLIGTSADEKVAQAVLQEGKTKIVAVTIDDKPYFTYYAPLTNRAGQILGMIFIGVDRTEFIKAFHSIVATGIILTIILLVVAYICIAIKMQAITKRMKKVCSHLKKLREKDFTQAVDEKLLEEYDETGDISRSVNKMQRDIKQVLSSINKLSDNVSSKAEQLSSTSQEMSSVSQTVTTTLEGITAGSTEQSNDLVNINEAVEKLGSSVNVVTESIGNINKGSEEIRVMAHKGHQDMRETIEVINTFKDEFAEYNEKMSQFEKQVQKINEIVSVIEGISKQTNLLALNAAIEAARAGEAGKGFSVVAEEIRNLAEESQKSTKDITDIINDTSNQTEHLMNGTEKMNKNLADQIKTMNSMIVSFENIIQGIREVTPQIKSTKDQAELLSKQKDVIVDKINNASAIAEQLSAAHQEISASLQNLSASNEEVAEAAITLDNMTKELQAGVSVFKF